VHSACSACCLLLTGLNRFSQVLHPTSQVFFYYCSTNFYTSIHKYTTECTRQALMSTNSMITGMLATRDGFPVMNRLESFDFFLAIQSHKRPKPKLISFFFHANDCFSPVVHILSYFLVQ